MSDPWHVEPVDRLIYLPEPQKWVEQEDADYEYSTTRYLGAGIPISGADYPRPDTRYGWEQLTPHDQCRRAGDIIRWRRSKRIPRLVDIRAHIAQGDYPKNEHGQWVVPMRCGLSALIDTVDAYMRMGDGNYCIQGRRQLWVGGPFDKSQWKADGHGLGAYDSYYLLPPGAKADPEKVAQFNGRWDAHPEWKQRHNKDAAQVEQHRHQPEREMMPADIGLAAATQPRARSWFWSLW